MKKVIIIGDFGKDLDDELSLVFASAFKEDIKLLGVVANLYPSTLRADIAKSTLNELLMFDTKVAVGNNVKESITVYDYEKDISYLQNHNIELKGEELLKELLLENEVHIVLQSAITDFAKFYKENSNLVYNRVSSVTIMGGIKTEEGKPVLENGFVVPDTAANNMFDIEAAEYVYEKLQIDNIELNISTRYFAYECPITADFYKKISFSRIGESLNKRSKEALTQLFKDTQKTEDRHLPERCSKDWYLKTFTDLNQYFRDDEEIYDFVTKINIYDPLNLLLLIDNFKEAHCEGVKINNVNIYGLNETETGFKATEAKKAMEYIEKEVIANLGRIETYKSLSIKEKMLLDEEMIKDEIEKEYFNNYIIDFVKKTKEGEEKEVLNKLKTTLEEMYAESYKKENREKARNLKLTLKKIEFYLNF